MCQNDGSFCLLAETKNWREIFTLFLSWGAFASYLDWWKRKRNQNSSPHWRGSSNTAKKDTQGVSVCVRDIYKVYLKNVYSVLINVWLYIPFSLILVLHNKYDCRVKNYDCRAFLFQNPDWRQEALWFSGGLRPLSHHSPKRAGLEPTTYHFKREHANHYTTLEDCLFSLVRVLNKEKKTLKGIPPEWCVEMSSLFSCRIFFFAVFPIFKFEFPKDFSLCMCVSTDRKTENWLNGRGVDKGEKYRIDKEYILK